MARIPDKVELTSKLAELPAVERRGVIRAVSRGRAVEKRAHAHLAVGVARRQRRFWRWAWLLGPAIGLAQAFFVDLQTAVLNALVGTVALGIMSAFWLWRARRAERVNLALAEGRRGEVAGAGVRRAGSRQAGASWRDRVPFIRSSSDRGAQQASTSSRGHLPGESRRPDGSRPSDHGVAGSPRPRDRVADGPKPPQPRGRKRRN